MRVDEGVFVLPAQANRDKSVRGASLTLVPTAAITVRAQLDHRLLKKFGSLDTQVIFDAVLPILALAN